MTDCSKQLPFQGILKLPVAVDFDGGNLTSDGGVLWLRPVDEGHGLTEGLARGLVDHRDPGASGTPGWSSCASASIRSPAATRTAMTRISCGATRR